LIFNPIVIILKLVISYSAKIPDWPENERPRERLFHHGAQALSDAELLAIILRTGSGRMTSVDLARKLLNDFDGLRGLDSAHINKLCAQKGIGLAKAAQMKAALELARRLAHQQWKQQQQIKCSDDVYQMMRLRMRDLPREEFHTLFLTNRHEIISDKVIFEGSLTESVVSPREIIRCAIEELAACVVLLHNHPSGDPNPSPEDKKVTQRISLACQYAEISVLDHIIIGKDSYFSFADTGLI
jgi:DNA repair protein RadC